MPAFNSCKYCNDSNIEIQPVLLDYLLPVSRSNLLIVAWMIGKHDRYRISYFIPYLVRPTLPSELIAILFENLLRLSHSWTFTNRLVKTKKIQKNKRWIVFPPLLQFLEPCCKLQMLQSTRYTRISVGILRYIVAMRYRVIKWYKTKIICIFHICYLPKNNTSSRTATKDSFLFSACRAIKLYFV